MRLFPVSLVFSSIFVAAAAKNITIQRGDFKLPRAAGSPLSCRSCSTPAKQPVFLADSSPPADRPSVQATRGTPPGNSTWTSYGYPPAPSPPNVTSVISAGAFGGFPASAPGSWIEIYGVNLAPDTRSWAATDFNGVNAPTSLDGVRVTVAGQSAFVDYISSGPGQINVQLPAGLGAGTLPLIVSNANGSSQPFNITVNTAEPGLLAPSAFKIAGTQYVVAVLPDGSFVLPPGAISGVSSRPAKPGDTVILFGIGFGPVTPAIPAGQIVSLQNQLSAPLQILFGQTPAQINFFGLSPGFVGLYQFNVVVPPVPDGDLVPLTFNLGGTAGAQTLFTAVHQ